MTDNPERSYLSRWAWYAEYAPLAPEHLRDQRMYAISPSAVLEALAEIATLRTALTALVTRAPIADLTVLPGAGCAYCHGPHYRSRYEKRMMAYDQEGSEWPPPSGDEATYAPFTEHRAGCPVVAGRAVLGAGGDQ